MSIFFFCDWKLLKHGPWKWPNMSKFECNEVNCLSQRCGQMWKRCINAVAISHRTSPVFSDKLVIQFWNFGLWTYKPCWMRFTCHILELPSPFPVLWRKPLVHWIRSRSRSKEPGGRRPGVPTASGADQSVVPVEHPLPYRSTFCWLGRSSQVCSKNQSQFVHNLFNPHFFRQNHVEKIQVLPWRKSFRRRENDIRHHLKLMVQNGQRTQQVVHFVQTQVVCSLLFQVVSCKNWFPCDWLKKPIPHWDLEWFQAPFFCFAGAR